MKKILVILTTVISVGTLAKGGAGYHMNQTGTMPSQRGKMMMQYDNLTEEQLAEFNKIHYKHRGEMQKSMLDIKEIDLKIQKELIADKPNQKNIEKLIDQKTRLNSQHQKDMLEFKLEMKEKFGIEIMGLRQGRMMGM